MKKLLFLLSAACSSLLLHAQTNQVVWLNGNILYEHPVSAIDSITYDMSNVVEGDTLKLILPRATQQNPPSTTSPKVKLLDAQTNQAVWLNGKLLYRHPVTTIDTVTYEKDHLITGDTLKLIMPRTTKEIVYQTITQEIHDTITNVIRDTIINEVRDTVTNVVRDTIHIYTYCTTDNRNDGGVLTGVFSVSGIKKVAFTKGNLQYTQSTSTWSFAENQYDMLGTANVIDGTESYDATDGYSKNGSELADKIDLFGWSSTGTVEWGISTSTSAGDYAGDFVDWGTNTIDFNGPNLYRTLTIDEWNILLRYRPSADNLKGVARINLNADGTQYANGLILLPDDWTCPAGITFKSGFASEGSIEAYAPYQTFTLAQWQQLEAAGAVFLPASGYRDGSSMSLVQNYGSYWSATADGSSYAYGLGFYSSGAYADDYTFRNFGQAVRLVKDL